MVQLVNAEPVGMFDGSSDLFRFNNDGQTNSRKKKREIYHLCVCTGQNTVHHIQSAEELAVWILKQSEAMNRVV